ncbi:MAG: zinc-dependent metalloprotease [Gemmatimonadota bacterium]|nr:zinc-dependent metalloprotease [Gemmatimonadota bacterium]
MRRILSLLLGAISLSASPLLAQGGLPPIADRVRGFQAIDGYLPTYWDNNTGKLWMEIPRLDEEMIYVVSLPAGLGSNDIGLDRGQLGGTRVVKFQRVGPRILMLQPNYRYRAERGDAAEKLAVEQSFAQSIIWGFTAVAETDGRVLVDATDFVMRDAHGVIGSLAGARQGSYRLDTSRSALYLERTKGFPRNSEIEVTLTFASDQPGGLVRTVAASAEAVTVRQHHSFVALPEPGYVPRLADPRSGFGGPSFADYSVPIAEPTTVRYISRHRLQKRDPSAAMSEPVKPIIYYLDRGTPEPIRTALLTGARWWNQAFEAAGYRDAFRVEMMPEGADPMDVRYNLIQWVHRSTRGWSYGSSVTDPRTGEIIKGHVSLGSLRVRQDFLIAEGLLAPYVTGNERATEAEAMSLARLRQLSAHEVGHTLGISHNYLSSTADRASVMDYPHPFVQLRGDGSIDLSQAYVEGIGAWDKEAIRYGYSHFPTGQDEGQALERILSEARGRGLLFLTDQDGRPTGSSHPETHLWDNGTDAAAELDRMMLVRRAALDRFGANAIPNGRPMATIEEALVPLYLHHRYQVEAASKMVAGQAYTYAIRGDGQVPVTTVPAANQLRALNSMLATLRPAELAMPRRLLDLIPPRPAGYPAHRELFPRRTWSTFDAIAPAAIAADMTVALILQPERAARLIQQHALQPTLPSLEGVVDQLIRATFTAAPTDQYLAEVGRSTQRVVADRLMLLVSEAGTSQVRAIASLKLEELRVRMAAAAATLPVAERAHRQLLARDIARFFEGNYDPARLVSESREAPPGAPIGNGDGEWWPWTP